VIGAGSATQDVSRAGTAQQRSRGVRPIVLAWAVVASVAVHAGLLVATLPGGPPGVPQLRPPDLKVSIAPAEAEIETRVDVPVVAPTVLSALAASSSFKAPLPQAGTHAVPPLPRSAGRTGFGPIDVVAEPVTDSTRVGRYLARQLSEFPAEIDRPARVDGRIVARYPVAALAQGREEAVVVWLIVEPSGEAVEIHVVEGTEEFANEAVAALRAARFLPAEDNLKPIRYPIALQFDFRAGSAATARAATK